MKEPVSDSRKIAGVPVRHWEINGNLDPEVLRTTAEACAWLVGIAEHSVAHHGWHPAIVQWLEAIGASADQQSKVGLQ